MIAVFAKTHKIFIKNTRIAACGEKGNGDGVMKIKE